MSNKEITTWKIPQEYIDQQQKIQTQDKLIEELEKALEYYFKGDEWDIGYRAKQALAKIKEYKEKKFNPSPE